MLVLSLLLAGCSHAPPPGLIQYLRQVTPYQQALGDLLGEMKRIPTRALAERSGAAQALLGKLQQSSAKLKAMSVPPQAALMQSNLLALYATLENYTTIASSGLGDPREPRLQKLSADWTREIKVADQELDKLSHLVGQ